IWGEGSHMTREGRNLMKVVVAEEVEVLGIVPFVECRVTVSLSARRKMQDVSSVGILVTKQIVTTRF
ncbi:hypothetical protein A2U01_0091703, partial [Trifolium medium]|nr:hypothetical protein [Trifolium medium]